MIRFATKDDLAKVTEIERLSFAEPCDAEYFRRALENIFVVFDQEGVLGFLIACICEVDSTAVILKVAVHPDHRGKGVAKALLERSIEVIAEKGVLEIILDVDLVNLSAIKLYGKVGFELTNTLVFPCDIAGDEQTLYIMKKRLT